MTRRHGVARRLLCVMGAWWAAHAGAVALASDASDAGALWTSAVQPLLDQQCVKCHGPIEVKAGLELDTAEAVLKGGEDGPVVVPGNPAQSKLYKALAADADPHMPPKKQLEPKEQEIIRSWIEALGREPAATQNLKPKPFPKVLEGRGYLRVSEAIDAVISGGWKARGINPAPELSDERWLRRVTLDVAGRIASAAEVEAFMKMEASTRREQTVDRLLGSPEYAAHQRDVWDVLLLGRGRRDNTVDRRKQNGWHRFLETSFAQNRPWNEVVRDFIAGRATEENRKGAAWFLAERRNDHQAIAEAVAPVIYGTTIDCAQCHDHPLAREIKQAHYWGLVAAFNRSKNVDGTGLVGESAIGGFVNFTNLKKESQPALVTLLGGPTLEEKRPADGVKETDDDAYYLDPKAKARVPKVSRREAFAQLATEKNPRLARALVNQVWAQLTGRGIVHPANEMVERNPPSHPELLDWLAQDFTTSKYDVRRLIRGIVLSKSYALAQGDTAHEAAPELFASALERPLSAEQLARSWRIILGATPEDETLQKAAVAAIPDLMPKVYQASPRQAQFLSHGAPLVKLIDTEGAGVIDRLSHSGDAAASARAAFMAVLGREPDQDELSEITSFLVPSDPPQGTRRLRDLIWALMTSPEFLTVPR